MTGIAILDVAIGLVVVYLLLGLLCAVVGEWIAQARRLRARTLRRGIETLLADTKYRRVTEGVYRHPLIAGLKQGERDPSYIPGMVFAKAFLGETEKRLAAIGDELSPAGFIGNIDRIVAKFEQLKLEIFRKGEIVAQRQLEADQVLDRLLQREKMLSKSGATPAEIATAESQIATAEEMLKNARRERADYERDYLGYAGTTRDKTAQIEAEQVCYRHVAEVLRSFIGSEGATLEQIEQRLANWYDLAMGRVSGWYRRKAGAMALVLAAAAALSFNADTIGMARNIWVDREVRDVIRRAADLTAQRCSLQEFRVGDKPACSVDELVRTVEARRPLPLGWHADAMPLSRNLCPDGAVRPCAPAATDYMLWVLGILLSIAAIWFSALFWFDLVRRFVTLRSDGKPPST